MNSIYRLWAFRRSFEKSEPENNIDTQHSHSQLRGAIVGTIMPCKPSIKHIPSNDTMWKTYKNELNNDITAQKFDVDNNKNNKK